ncbi:LysR family transcriptional regulator [Duganella sp. BJB488]|uniref:LysR family transcriptional regulator n=1 Tax=unclassified Duganella TaxID=2636909 RepID=UPI000E35124B|nr:MULTISPECIES: LysR family transcriptional regulator [unclassified Duganella]RFP09182.1 LysR family transcriptional regulator [Duganella sp. BJB475]RFP13311.1 LysR family transcriptional regulator [Duganella sp. BJB489]RFP17241.1 LysR family transcriptional regulator [Duganella sp. BJB488]RFP25408.1 LysR family transcriptional regulator [Duganella sp. BJB476]RFP31615.1 LysR family transcriptional regulator [Duganella sp. BJB480]
MAIDEEITLKKLEVFLAFMQTNKLASVAETLGQSTVSVHRALHSLEEGMRCPLYKRVGRNLVPLHTAYKFEEYAKRVLDECEEGVRKVRELAGVNATRLKIGSLYSLTLHCIPQLVIGVKLRKPGLDIDLTLGSNQDLLLHLEEGRLDAIVIGIQHPIHNSELMSVPLFNDDIFLAAPSESPYSGLQQIDLQDLRTEKFVTLNEGFVTSQSFTHAFELAGFAPDITMRVGDIFSLINLVSGGIGYTLLPGRVRTFSPRIRLIPLAQKYSSHQSIILLMAKSRERDPNLLALAAECRMYGRRDLGGQTAPLPDDSHC